MDITVHELERFGCSGVQNGEGIDSPAFHPLSLREPSSSLPRPAFVHPLSPCLCLGNIDPLVARFATPPPQPRVLNLLLKAPSPALLHPAFVHPQGSPRLRLGNVDTPLLKLLFLLYCFIVLRRRLSTNVCGSTLRHLAHFLI